MQDLTSGRCRKWSYFKMDKTYYIYFSLCCLNYDKDISVTAGLLISYGIVEFAKKLEKEIELNDDDYDKIENYIENNNLKKSIFPIDDFIILSAIKLNISISSLHWTKKNHSEINSYIINFEERHGTDAKVKIHKDLLFEVRDKKFDERLFRVYCGIVSIIGNKKFVRITNKRISYRMLGFKSEDIYYKENLNYILLTARQVTTCTDKLSEKNFFGKLTYRNRLTFYSTAYRGKKFNEVLTSSIALNKEKKEVNRILNQQLTSGVEKKRKEIREKLISGLSINEVKCEMELMKAI